MANNPAQPPSHASRLSFRSKAPESRVVQKPAGGGLSWCATTLIVSQHSCSRQLHRMLKPGCLPCYGRGSATFLPGPGRGVFVGRSWQACNHCNAINYRKHLAARLQSASTVKLLEPCWPVLCCPGNGTFAVLCGVRFKSLRCPLRSGGNSLFPTLPFEPLSCFRFDRNRPVGRSTVHFRCKFCSTIVRTMGGRTGNGARIGCTSVFPSSPPQALSFPRRCSFTSCT